MKKKHLLMILFIVGISFAGLIIPKRTYSITLPNTTYSLDSSVTTGNHSWYTSAIPITLQATQGTNPVKSITYRIDTQTPVVMEGNTTTITLVQQGLHILYFYATDTSNNTETTKTFPYTIDVVAPTNWNTFTLTNTGNAHTFSATVKITDKTSGLDPSTAEFQYSVDDGATWGYYSTPTSCSSTWNTNLWKSATTTPNTASTTSATINIPTTDYCNSNWSQTKYLRIRIRDMAGILSTKQYALMAPWLSTTTGDVYSTSGIDMTTENSNSATGIVTSGTGMINNFSSSVGWQIRDYTQSSNFFYTNYYAKLGGSATTLPAILPGISGIYKSNDLSVSNIPSEISTIQNVGMIILVNGNLFIDSNIILHPTSSIVWIVSGDIGIKNSVTQADGIYLVDGDFNSSYNTGTTNALTINGMVASNDTIILPRSLSGTTNQTTPAEKINFNPGLFTNIAITNALKSNANVTWKELITY